MSALRAGALVAGLLVVAAGCGSSGGPGPAGGGPTSGRPSATATTRTSPTAATSPPAAHRRMAADGDVDGDGKPDMLSVTGGGVLTARYSGGGSDLVRFRTSPATARDVRLLGASDADRDGHAEVFVQYDHGALTTLVTLFHYTGGHLRLVTAGGQQASLRYGRPAGSVATFACRPSTRPSAALAATSATSTGPDVYRLQVTYYALDGSALVTVGHRTLGPGSLEALPIDHDQVSGTGGCGTVRPWQ